MVLTGTAFTCALLLKQAASNKITIKILFMITHYKCLKTFVDFCHSAGTRGFVPGSLFYALPGRYG